MALGRVNRYSAVVSETVLLPVAEAKRQVTVDRIRRAARRLLITRGLDVTMSEIAAAADVSRRTLFRHFDSREKLLASALEEGIEQYGAQLPAFDGDWRTWLRGLCDAAHRMQAGYGRGYWELMHRTDLPGEIAAVEQNRRRHRRAAMERIAAKLWREAGGRGRPPAAIIAVVGGHLSARFTAAVTEDAGQTWQIAAGLAYDAISAALERPDGDRH
jgi:AcrR family transcriptional regulator